VVVFPRYKSNRGGLKRQNQRLIEILSNLLALSVVYFSLGSFFPSLQREEIRVGYLSLVLFFLTLFIHPWTFIQYSLVFLLFLFLKWNENRSNIFYRSLGLFYIVGLVIALTAFFILSTGSIQPYLNEFNLSIFIDSFKAVNLVLAGALSNLVPWVLSTYYLSTQGDEGDFIKFMRILVFSTSVMFLFLNPFDKARVLNNLPVGCFAALGVSKVVSETEGRTGLIFILYVMAHSLVYLFRTLYFII